ncbi:hypothetical protein AK812_SmicGene18376 [Symbiodinium microadriaticum]|uniref:K Homology domain-containing protein n=1 Tax=Symbiodinium microadriaticum TaxID=2951 RepID=A0A1Q9DV92_SYMMI|nr:hypothetical protein AK812_SmicGene18376 [Symbiodinium microadriaticum]
MKRGREGRGSGPPAKRGRGPPVGVGRSAFKVLCPDRLVAAVLGSSGQTVAKIQEHSGCHCNFSRRNEFFPDTNLRLLVISGPGPAEIVACLELLLEQEHPWANRDVIHPGLICSLETRASMLKRYITIYSRWRRWLREGKNAFPFGRQPELADSFWLGKVADFDPHRRATEGRMVPAIKDTIVAVALVVLVLILLVIL